MLQVSKMLSLSFIVLSLFVSCSPKNKDKKNGSTYFTNLRGEPTTLNPITSTDHYATKVQAYVIDTLLYRDADTYEWKPRLASSWEISKDNKIFDFTLRPGATWHDGKPVTAEDVKFSFDVIFDDQYNTASKRPYFEGIEKAEIIAPDKIRFTAKTQYFQNFDVVSELLKIIPKHIYQNSKDNKELNKTIIGSGPYIVKSLERGKKLTLDQNPDWWGRKDPYFQNKYNFKKIVMRFVSEESVALEMLKKGDLDFNGLTGEDYAKKTDGPEWGKKVFKVKAENKSSKGYTFIGWNLSIPQLKDKKVRQALAHLVNRPMMLEKFFFNLSDNLTGPLNPQSDYVSPKAKVLDYDPAKAAQLFKEAGWADSDNDSILDKTINGKKEKLAIDLIVPGGTEIWMKILTVYKEDAKKAGVEIEIKQLEWNSFIKLIDERKFSAVALAWGGGGVDWDPKQIWHSSSIKGGSNFIGYKNPQVDQWIDEARNISDKVKRTEVLHKVYDAIADDAPYIFLFSPRYDIYGHTTKVVKEKDTLQYEIGVNTWTLAE